MNLQPKFANGIQTRNKNLQMKFKLITKCCELDSNLQQKFADGIQTRNKILQMKFKLATKICKQKSGKYLFHTINIIDNLISSQQIQ